MTVRVIVAIDFGTHGTGFAWAFVNDLNESILTREVLHFDAWPGQPISYAKNLSGLLLDKRGNLFDWGYRGLEKWRREGQIDGRQYFSGYKMGLTRETESTLGSETSIEAANTGLLADRQANTSDLVQMCLNEVHSVALEQIMNMRHYREDEIRWCITVPAIWDDYAKQLMLEAAKKAGFPSDPDRLKLAIEPEAAALYCVSKGDSSWQRNSKRLLIVDAGGGTIDITSYKVINGKLRQLGSANGDKAGSEYLNLAFANQILADRFGVDFLHQLSARKPYLLFSMVQAFEKAKRDVDPDRPEDLILEMSAQLYAEVAKEQAVHDRLRERQGGVDMHVIVPFDETLQVFETVTDQILDAVEEQLVAMRKDSRETGGEMVILAGGFAESKVLQHRLKARLNGQGIEFIIPPRPSVAVLVGAVHHAYNPFDIIERRSPMTYGVECLMPFREGIDPEARRRRATEPSGVDECDGRIDVFVERREPVATDTPIVRGYVPHKEDQTSITLNVYITRDTSPEYVTDSGAMQAATMNVDIGHLRHLPRDERNVAVHMFFGETTIRVEAHADGTDDVRSVEVDWRPTW